MNLKLLKLLDKTPKPTFRIKSTTGDLVEIKDFTKVDLGVSATFYVHKSIKGDSYVVSEAHTGLKIENGANEGIAIGKARHKVSEYVKKNSEEAFLNIIRTEFKKIYPNIPFPEDKPVQPVKIVEQIKVEEPKQLDIEQAFTNALDYTNFVDLSYMSNELGISEEEISAELLERKLVFVNPGTNLLETNDEYLSGNVREKLRIAEKALETNSSYERNVEALKAVIPEPIPSALIQYSLGAAWIPKEIFEAFALSIFKQKVKVEYISATGKFSARSMNTAHKTPQVLNTYAAGGKNGIEIFNATLNNQQIIVSDKGVKKINETAEAQSMQEQMQEEFQQWIRVNKEIEEQTEVIYNEQFNSYVKREIRIPTIEYYPNASKHKKLMRHQKLAVVRSLTEATGIAHFAGAGKSIECATTTMELRRLGYAKKPMIVVQKKTLGDFVQEFIDLYPTANLLIASDSELTAQGRPYFYQRIRDEDFDAVIMPHSQFELIPDNIERQRKNLGEQLAVAYDIMEKTNKQVSPLEYAQAKRVVKAIQKELDDIDVAEEVRIEVQNKAYEMYGTPPLLDFEQMGIDALLIDECFPYETPILTTKGMFPIGYIVDNKIEAEVLSYNKETDTYEPKKIVRWLPKPLTQKLVKVTHSRGSFVCTENHKIFTDIGYVEAKNLTNERSITYADLPMVQSEESKQKREQLLQSGMLDGKQKTQHNEGLPYVHTLQKETSEYNDCEILQQGLPTRSGKASKKDVFTLQNKRDTVFNKRVKNKVLFSKLPQGRSIINAEHNIIFRQSKRQNPSKDVRMVQYGNSKNETTKILRSSMCSVLPKFIRRSKGKANRMRQEIFIQKQLGEEITKRVITNEVKQPIKKSKGSSENKCSKKRKNFFIKRRQWSANKASNNATRSIRSAKRMDGVGYKDCRSERPISISTELLQSRHWYSSSENFYRSGREVSSFEEVEVFRPQENGNIECVRVESCEIYERGDRCEFTFGSRESETVYDIEVEDNHNYFAAGVLVSNCHQYKRLGLQTSLTNVKGIDTTKSKRAQSCLLKVRWVQEIKNGKNVVFYTGTPISNTMAEAWVMIKFLRPDILKEIGIEHFDQFAKTFGQIVPSLEQTGGGTFKIQNRFAKFQNLPEFIAAFLRSWDVVSPEDVPEFIENNTLPKLIGGKIEQVIVKRSDELVEQIAEFRKELEWYEGLEGVQKRQYNYIPLVIYNRAKQASIDLRLLNPTNNDNPMSKVNQMIRSAIDKYRTHGKPQMIFCDLYQSPEPKHEFMDEDCTIPNTAYGKPRFNLFNDIKAKLIKLGVKPNEIAILTEPKYDKMDKVKELFDLANKGIVKFLLGTTQKLGIGVNAQRKLYWLHHLDAPQRPMDFSQRNARIIRQGNLNPEVGITAYGTEKTLDSAAFQRLSIKQFFINQVLKGQTTERVTEDAADEAQMTFDEMMAHLSDSPYAMQKLLVDNKLKSERMKLDNFNAKQFQTQRQLNYLSDDLVKMRLDYEQQLKYSKVASENFIDGTITELRIGDKVFTEHLGIEADGYVEMLINLYFGSPTKSAKGAFMLNGIKVLLEVNNTDEWSKKTKQMVDKPILSYTMPEIGLFPSFYGNGISVHSNSGTGLITSARYKVHDAIHAPVDTKRKIERYELNAEELTRTLDNVFDYTKMEALEAEIEALKEKMLNEKNVGVEI